MLVVIALDYEGEGPVFDSWLGRKNFLMNSGLFTISLLRHRQLQYLSKGLLEI